MRRLVIAVLALAGCTRIEPPAMSPLASFAVKVEGVYRVVGATRVPLEVVSVCAEKYAGEANVPLAERGTEACPYAIARGEIEIDVTTTALDLVGAPATSFNGSVAFRVVPGDLTGDYLHRWAPVENGVAHGTVRTAHQYGQVKVWGEHAPPKLQYSDGGYAGDLSTLPRAPDKWTYATGLSPTLFFEEPSLAKIQIPDGFDNRSSPLVGEFITIGKRPESGQKLLQSCVADVGRDGQVAKMVVTGTDPSGFYVTDITACRLIEETRDATGVQVRVSEPPEECVNGKCAIGGGNCTTVAQCKSYLPGTYGSMFIYNYSFPDGLDTGDLLWTLSGSVQEFTSTTQLTFPSWTIAERVHQLPEAQWNKWLDQVQITEVNMRLCGGDNTLGKFLTDSLCGHNRRNLKMESLESSLVRVPSVRFPKTFVNCDMNADSSVPFFCETTDQGVWIWSTCAFGEVEPPQDMVERVCNHDCVVGQNQYSDTLCSEESTFLGFGQFVVELTPPGLPGTTLDSSLPARYQTVTLGAAAAKPMTAYPVGMPLAITCTAPAHYRFGDGTTADATDPLIAAGEVVLHTLAEGETTVALIAEGTAPAGAKCSVAENSRVRINLITKDAIPELNPDCRDDDADPAKATQCQAMHAATFDVIGHLRHVQPARPRWVVLPRDVDDVCCHPGKGLQCPKPIKQCPEKQ